MSQRPGQEIGWVPKTKLGRQVQQGEIISMEEIFTQGLRIKEPEIVDTLLPNIQQEVLGIGFVQKQTDAGERSRFRAIVAVGNGDGYIGVGEGKARQVRTAIDKGTIQAKLNVIPVRRGCGSWECRCGRAHTVLFTVTGKCGSVRLRGTVGDNPDVEKTLESLTLLKVNQARLLKNDSSITGMLRAAKHLVAW